MISTFSLTLYLPLTAILIGFHGPRTEVAENDNGFEFGDSCFFDENFLFLYLESNTTTEIEYYFEVRHINGMGNATVNSELSFDVVSVDAIFGLLYGAQLSIGFLYRDGLWVPVSIINDHQPEPTEFFQLSIGFLPTPIESGIAFPATCLNDDSEQFLCIHTVYILDDDSKYCKLLLTLGTHAQRGLQYLVSVCLSVCLHIVMVKILHSLPEQIIASEVSS